MTGAVSSLNTSLRVVIYHLAWCPESLHHYNCSSSGGAGVGGGLPPLPVPLLAPSGGSPFGPACGCSALRLSREGRGVRSCGGDGLCTYKNPGACPGFLLVRGGFSLPR